MALPGGNLYPSSWAKIAGTPFPTVSAIGVLLGAPVPNNGCSFGPDTKNPLTGMLSTTGGQAECDAYLVSQGGGLAILVNGQALEITPSTGNEFKTPYELGTASGISNWAGIPFTGKPELTIGTEVNSGADFDPSTAGTQTGGLYEYMQYAANATVFSSNMYAGQILPGVVGVSIPVEVNAKFLVLRGSGMQASCIKANFTPTAGQNLIYWPLTPTNTGAIGDGTYIGHLSFNLNNKAFGYGVCPGYPGGYHPDLCASATLFEHLVTSGTGGVTVGVCLSSIEDTLSFQNSFSGATTGVQGSPTGVYGLEWIVYDGSMKIIGGNNGCINMQGSHPNIVDSVWLQLTIGNTVTAPCKVNVVGCGSNGYPSTTIAAITPVIYVYSTTQVVYFNTVDCDMSLNCSGSSNYATAYSGLIGGPGAGGVYYADHGSYMNVNSTGQNQPLFGLLSYGGSMASGYATLASGGILSSIASFLGTGNFINGTLVLEGGTNQYALMNGFIRPVGTVSAPFGSGVVTWQGSSVSAAGPGVSSGSATPASGTTYTVGWVPQFFYWSGGTGVSVYVNGSATALPSGVTSIQLYPGNTIEWTYSTAPTVVDVGN